MQQAERAAARFAHRDLSSRQAKRPQMRHPPGILGGAVDQDKLPAPDRSVGAVTGAIPGYAKHAPRAAPMFKQAGEDVGEMVLHGHERQAKAPGKLSRSVVRVGVADDTGKALGVE